MAPLEGIDLVGGREQKSHLVHTFQQAVPRKGSEREAPPIPIHGECLRVDFDAKDGVRLSTDQRQQLYVFGGMEL